MPSEFHAEPAEFAKVLSPAHRSVVQQPIIRPDKVFPCTTLFPTLRALRELLSSWPPACHISESRITLSSALVMAETQLICKHCELPRRMGMNPWQLLHQARVAAQHGAPCNVSGSNRPSRREIGPIHPHSSRQFTNIDSMCN